MSGSSDMRWTGKSGRIAPRENGERSEDGRKRREKGFATGGGVVLDEESVVVRESDRAKGDRTGDGSPPGEVRVLMKGIDGDGVEEGEKPLGLECVSEGQKGLGPTRPGSIEDAGGILKDVGKGAESVVWIERGGRRDLGRRASTNDEGAGDGSPRQHPDGVGRRNFIEPGGVKGRACGSGEIAEGTAARGSEVVVAHGIAEPRRNFGPAAEPANLGGLSSGAAWRIVLRGRMERDLDKAGALSSPVDRVLEAALVGRESVDRARAEAVRFMAGASVGFGREKERARARARGARAAGTAAGREMSIGPPSGPAPSNPGSCFLRGCLGCGGSKRGRFALVVIARDGKLSGR